jgi:F1F0 ATPase subunit 2
MADYGGWVLVFAAGLLLGGVFFGGLWWTVRIGMASKRPALWFLGSLLLRTGVVLAGFYQLGGDDWRRLLLGLLGFVCARVVVSRLTRLVILSNPGE